MSNLVGQFIEEAKGGLQALTEENPELSTAVMRALITLAEYEAVVPQEVTAEQEVELQNAFANTLLASIEPQKLTMQVLTEEQQRALENRAYAGTPESTTEDDEIDEITAALNELEIDDVLEGLDLDNLDEDVEDLLAMFDEDDEEYDEEYDEEDEDDGEKGSERRTGE